MRFVLAATLIIGSAFAGCFAQPQRALATTTYQAELRWHTDYAEAYRAAQRQKKMLFIFFHQPGENPARDEFRSKILARPEVQAQLANYTLAELPLNATSMMGGNEVRVLSHPSFREMMGRQGMAIVDLASEDDKELYGQVVSTFPFSTGQYYSLDRTQVALDLPPGTLTQRTMVFAVRVHPEAPRSTRGLISRLLMREASRQSTYQARIGVQGHQNWDSRFQQISAQLPGGLRAQEVVAESWPGESLVEAAEDCVHSWRQSSGHWGAVRREQPLFGFDIRRGSNGIWYATGIFGNRDG